MTIADFHPRYRWHVRALQAAHAVEVPRKIAGLTVHADDLRNGRAVGSWSYYCVLHNVNSWTRVVSATPYAPLLISGQDAYLPRWLARVSNYLCMPEIARLLHYATDEHLDPIDDLFTVCGGIALKPYLEQVVGGLPRLPGYPT